jgi:hypothetical protein
MPFAKLDSEITKSSIWSEPYHVRIVFVSFVSAKDENGFVGGARTGLARMCNVTLEEFDEAIDRLQSPDEESKTPDNEGRRIMKVPGGYIILNHELYRLPEDEKREKTRERVKRYRALQSVTECYTPLQSVTPVLHSVSVSDSLSAVLNKEQAKIENALKTTGNKNNTIPPPIEDVVEYCTQRGYGVDPERWFDHYAAKGWVVGKTKMVDWKAAVRTWEKKESVVPKKPQQWKIQ